MTRQYVRKPVSWAKIGPNVRSDLGDEAKVRALARSRAKCQITPLIARPDGIVLDGNRTIWGCQLEGMLDVELDFIVTDEDLTPDQIRTMQANSAFHREPLAQFDIASVMRDTLAANPGMTRKQMAEEVFDIDPSLVSRYLSVFESNPEVQEAAKAGKLGVSDWYTIQKSTDQAASLGLRLGGATRDELERQVRKQRDESKPAVRVSRIKCPLPGGPTVTVAAEELSLDEAIDALKEAMKAMAKARDTGLNAATAQKVWRDMANAS